MINIFKFVIDGIKDWVDNLRNIGRSGSLEEMSQLTQGHEECFGLSSGLLLGNLSVKPTKYSLNLVNAGSC